MNFDSEFDDMSPVNPVVSSYNNTSSKIERSAPVNSIKKTLGIKSDKPSKETRILEIIPLCILQVVVGIVLKNILDIRKRCKCNENKHLATLLILLYSFLLIISGAAIVAILIGYPINTIKKTIHGIMIGGFGTTILLTFAYIYKVEDKCDCPQTNNIYNVLKLYLGFLIFLFVSSLLVYAFSYALD